MAILSRLKGIYNRVARHIETHEPLGKHFPPEIDSRWVVGASIAGLAIGLILPQVLPQQDNPVPTPPEASQQKPPGP